MREYFKYIVAFILMPIQAYSFDCETQNSGSWMDANTWINCNSSYPSDDDNAVIKSGHTVTLAGETSLLESLFVEGGGDLNIDQGTSVVSSINSNANVASSIDISNASVDLFHDFTINANDKNILIGEVNGDFDLILNSNSETHLVNTIGDVVPVNSLITDAQGTTFFSDPDGESNNNTLIVDQKIEINDPLRLTNHSRLKCFECEITFNQSIDSDSIAAVKDFKIHGSNRSTIILNNHVGSNVQLREFLIFNSNNATLYINTSEINTRDQQRYDLNILLNSPTQEVLMNSTADKTIRFGKPSQLFTIRSLLANNNSLTIDTAGNVDIISNVGDNEQALKNLTINTAANIKLTKDQIIVDESITFAGAVILENDFLLEGKNIDLQSDVDNGGFDLTLNTIDVIGSSNITGVLSGSGNLSKDGEGSIDLVSVNSISGNLTINNGTINTSNISENVIPSVSEITLFPQGTLSLQSNNIGETFTMLSGQILKGTGNVSATLNLPSGVTISPGINSFGKIKAQNVLLQTGSQFDVELLSANNRGLGLGIDTIEVADINLDTDTMGGATLNLYVSNDFNPSYGDTFTIINVTSVNAVLGTFNGLSEGAEFSNNGTIYSISYIGGDGNDVVLTAERSSIIHVDSSLQTSGDGESWDTAYNNLQEAIGFAVSGMEIWVAQGVYYPDDGFMQTPGDRTATFEMRSEISIFGGFDGTELNRTERDPDTNITILSGDIDGDDENSDGNHIAESIDDINGNNSYHVLFGGDVNSDTLFDGFTITAGSADDGSNTINERGAGIYCGADLSGPSINQVKFIGNYSLSMAAAIYGCSQNVSNSSFIVNQSDGLAGAVYAVGGHFENVIFERNNSDYRGGALFNEFFPINITNSSFIANQALNRGGAFYSSDQEVDIENVLFSGNYVGTTSSNHGGAIYLAAESNIDLINVTMTGNHSTGLGGAIYIDSLAMSNIQNSIIWNNSDSSNNEASSNIHLNGGSWGYTQSNSLVQYFGTSGTGNLDENPIFISNTNPANAPTTEGNARLNINSPAIAQGDDSFVTQSSDLDGNTRIVDTVEMGAYEFFSQSISVTVLGLDGTLVLQNNNAGDLNVNSDGMYTFSLEVARSDSYEVTILSQNTNVNQECEVINAIGTISNDMPDDIYVGCTTVRYAMGVNVTGLAAGATLEVQNNIYTMEVSKNGITYFPKTFNDGSSYAISIESNPTQPNQTCLIISGNGSGHINGADVIVDIECVTNQYNISVDVSGLAIGNSVQFDNNGESLTVSTDGQFTFATPLNDGSTYNVTVVTQPDTPNQTCSVINGSGTFSGSDVILIVTCTTNHYIVGGSLTGLADGNLIALDLDSQRLLLGENGAFAFWHSLIDESNYHVIVGIQPTSPNQTCEIENESGTISGNDVTNIEVSCSINTYFIGGTVTGLLSGNSMILQNNGTDDLSIHSNGAFAFNTPIQDEQSYSITISNQPQNPNQPCSVSNASNSVTGDDVINVEVNCENGNDFIYRNGFEVK